MPFSASNVRVVLVRPRNPLNIGAAARAMFNFGFEDLVVVAPHPPVWQEAKSAVGAETVLRAARGFSDLAAAIEDRTLVIGTSSLARRQISQPTVSLDQLGDSLKKHRAEMRLALVFGSEKTGLSKDDLSRCHSILRIPTSPACPTMNLGQAVAVCCYELSRLISKNRFVTRSTEPVSAGELERLLNAVEPLVEGTQGSRMPSRRYKARLRQMLLRSAMTSEDVTLALGVLRDLSWRIEHPCKKN
jgi:tRNA/rRNA methyltransferase